MGRIHRRIEKILKDEVKARIAYGGDAESIFSRTEVMDAVRDRVAWKGSGREPELADMYESGQISRRKFLAMLGLGIGGGVVATSGVGYFMGTKVFGNGEHDGVLTGLQTGSSGVADAPGSNVVQVSSLDEAESSLESGNQVILAEGEYDFSGRSIMIDSGDTALIGDGEVIFNVDGDTNDGTGIDNSSGDAMLKNITFRGKMTDDASKPGLEILGTGGRQIFDNVNMPDGTVDNDEGRAYYQDPDSHGGTGVVRNSYYANFASDTLYTDKGPMIVDGVMTQNCNVSMIRVGCREWGNEVHVRNCVVVIDGEILKSETGDRNARGIRVRHPAEVTIENCDVTYAADSHGGSPIELHDGANGASGVIRDTRILNDTGADAINDKGIGIDSWQAENVCIKGSGSLDHPFDSGVETGSSCPDPRTEAPEASGKGYGTAPNTSPENDAGSPC